MHARGPESVCIDSAHGGAIHVLMPRPGCSLPLYAGAAGRVMLALGDADPGAYLRDAPFPALTGHTLTTDAG